MKYLELNLKLKEVDIFMVNYGWDVSTKNELILKTKIVGRNANETPTFNTGASYCGLITSGKSQDEIAENLFGLMSSEKNKILLGTPNDYKEIIEWSPEEKRFKKRNLTERELLEFNCPW